MTVVAVAISAIILGSNSEESGTNIDERIYTLMEENFDVVHESEDMLFLLIDGDEDDIYPLFSEGWWTTINNTLSVIPKFNEQLSVIDISGIKKDFIKDSFSELANVVADNAEIYSKTLEFYNLFYKYLNSDRSDAEIRNSIIGFHEDGSKLLNLVNSLEVPAIIYVPADFARELFTTFTGSDYKMVGYTSYMGKIMAQIKDFGGNNE